MMVVLMVVVMMMHQVTFEYCLSPRDSRDYFIDLTFFVDYNPGQWLLGLLT